MTFINLYLQSIYFQYINITMITYLFLKNINSLLVSSFKESNIIRLLNLGKYISDSIYRIYSLDTMFHKGMFV